MQTRKRGFYEKYIKRLLDIVFSLLVIILLGWLYILLCLIVGAEMGSPVVFRQKRPGMIDPATGKERIFEMYKFRTMTDAKGPDGKLLPDEKRLNAFGRKLRGSSFDELPEVFNILKGDMSFVGPRPLLVQYLDRYSEEQHHRHDVRPGLTGLAQVNGRNALSWEEKFAYDLEYVQKISFLLDVKIFFKTIKVALLKNGISHEGSATMQEFMGNEAKAEERKDAVPAADAASDAAEAGDNGGTEND